MKSKRFSFSLLEILVALPLVSLLLFSVLKTYTAVLKVNHVANHSTSKLKEIHYFRERLKRMFRSLPEEEMQVKEKDEGIEFYYDNGVNKDPEASNTVLAQLFLKQNQLHLDVYKELEDEKKWIRSEELLSDVEDLQFMWGYINDGNIEFYPTIQKKSPHAVKLVVKSEEKNKMAIFEYFFGF